MSALKRMAEDEIAIIGYLAVLNSLFMLIFRCDYTTVQCSVLEKVLLHHPMVVDCGVFAKACNLRGEVPAAWVVLNPKAEANQVSS